MAKIRFLLEDNPQIIPVFYTPLDSSNRAESNGRHYRPLGPLTVVDCSTHGWSACMPRGYFLLRRRFSPRPFLFTYIFCQIKHFVLYFLTLRLKYCGYSWLLVACSVSPTRAFWLGDPLWRWNNGAWQHFWLGDLLWRWNSVSSELNL